MYCGFAKDAGAIVGVIGGESHALDLGEAQDTTGAEESLLGFDHEGREIAIVASIDPSSGDLEWVPTFDVDSAKVRTVAMSQMGSMLRDNDRNTLYEQAIARMVSSFTSQAQRPPVVLDIGAGTGLLSLFAARSGAASAVGIEMFDAMASVAQGVVEENGFSDRVSIINAKSTEIEQLPVPADILVTEVLDSALLGESILPTHGDALSRLIRRDGDGPIPMQADRVIPNRAEVFCSLVESWEVQSRVSVQGIKCGKEAFNPFRDEYAADCPGASAALPVHWEALEQRGSRLLSSPALCMKVSFCQERVLQEQEIAVWESELSASTPGTVTALLLWWKTYLLPRSLDLSQHVCYSTQPGAQNWQDHWQQVIFPLRQPIHVSTAGQLFRITLVHDEVGLWAFADPLDASQRNVTGVKRNAAGEEPRVRAAIPRPGDEKYLRPACSCGWHLLCSPQRIEMLSDPHYQDVWARAMEQAVRQQSARPEGRLTLLDVSDGSQLSLLAALLVRRLQGPSGLAAAALVSREKKDFSRLFSGQLLAANGLDQHVQLWDGQDLHELVDCLRSSPPEDAMHAGMEDEADSAHEALPTTSAMGQIRLLVSDCCYYQMHALPTWQALSFYYQRRAWNDWLDPQASILPARAHICAALVELVDLRVSHGLVGSVQGLAHASLDVVQAHWHEFLYPYYLANYRKRVLSQPVRLAVLDYYTLEEQFDRVLQCTAGVVQSGRCDCLAIWVDYDVDHAGECRLQQFDGREFATHTPQNLKFLTSPRPVQAGDSVEIAMALPQGSSDFQFGVF